jgi:hypothetical protein
MTDVLTAYELHGDMIAASNHVSDCVTEYQTQAKAWAQAEFDSEKAQAVTRPSVKKELGPKATVDDIRAAVLLRCADLILAELMADALKNSADRALKAALANLSALQSMAAALRSELQMARVDNYSSGP